MISTLVATLRIRASRRHAIYPSVAAMAVVLTFSGLVGCRGEKEGTSPSVPGKPIRRIAVAYALGGKGDLTYNDAAARGVDAIRKRGMEVSEYEPTTLDDYLK